MPIAFILALALAGAEPAPDAPQMVQASKLVCRYKAGAGRPSSPVCRGSSTLSDQECGCQSPDIMFREPACEINGEPVMVPAGKRLTPYDSSRLISCVEWDKRHGPKKPKAD